MERRSFIQASTALGLWGAAGVPARSVFAAQGLLELRAAPARQQLLGPEREPTAVWAYNGSVPGPLVRVRAGERVRVRLHNDLVQPTSVHWHGIRIDNAMDGVVGLTQPAVAPGASFDYDFVAPDAGSYWYHTHSRSWEQMERGLYGPLIVDEPQPPAVDRDLFLVLDDWRLRPGGALDEASFGSLHDWSHGGRMGNWLTVNGRDRPEFAVAAGDRVRLRLLNASNARILEVDLADADPTLVALDGHPLPPAAAPRPLVLAPGQRADLIVDLDHAPGTRLPIEEVSYSERYTCAWLAVGPEPAGRARRRDPVAALDARAHRVLDLEGASTTELHMAGGAMGGMRGAVHQGQYRDMRELAGMRKLWAFNGIAGDLDRPLLTTRLGQTVVVDMINDTRWPHAMHLHGHHFQVVRRDGAAVREPWRDTELMAPRERVAIGFIADNPGKWLFHCHMLEHHAAGMGTWIEVQPAG